MQWPPWWPNKRRPYFSNLSCSNHILTNDKLEMQWTHSISLKHLNNDDPSGHLSLSIGLIEQLRNSIYTDLALRIKESSLQTLKCRANQAGRQILKEPPLVGSQQVKDQYLSERSNRPDILSFPCQLWRWHFSCLQQGGDQRYWEAIAIGPLAERCSSGCCASGWWKLTQGREGGDSKANEDFSSFSNLNRACVVFQHIYEDSEQMS